MPRYLREGVASAALKAVSRRKTTASFFAAVLFTGANAEPFQYNDDLLTKNTRELTLEFKKSSIELEKKEESIELAESADDIDIEAIEEKVLKKNKKD